MIQYRTDLIFPVEIKYNLHKDNSEIWQICNDWNEVNYFKDKLVKDGYEIMLDNPKFRKWGKSETFGNRKYTLNLDVENKVIGLYYVNLGRIAVIDSELNIRETVKCGFNRKIPNYIILQIKSIFKHLDLVESK